MNNKMRDLFLQDLLKLISIKSFTGDNEGRDRCFEQVEAIARRFGFEYRRCARGKVLEVFPKNVTETQKIGIITHVDTVPFDEDEWTFNPLGEISGGRVYGRGSIDDKLGVIYSLYVLKELENQIIPSWKLIIGSKEEGTWDDMEDYQEEATSIPEFLFTIDGDGVQNGCRGNLDLILGFKRYPDSEKFVTIFETPNGVKNIVPNQVVVCVDGNIRVHSGKAAHSSRPELGVNAITQAYKAHSTVLEEEFEGFAKFMEDFMSGVVVGRTFKEETSSRETLLMPQTNLIPTMVKLERNRLYLTINVRLSPRVTQKAQVYNAFFELSKRYGCSVEVDELIMPAFIDEKSEEIQAMCRAYEKVIGKKRSPWVALGTGYNAAFPNAAIFGPRFAYADEKDSDLCHCKDENRSIEDIEKFYEMLKYYLKESLSVPEGSN